MKRRQFITLLGGAATWPITARAQQAERKRRIGVLMTHAENDAEFHDYLSAFREGPHKLGWTEGRNIQIDSRWGALDDPEARQRSAKELVALQPDLILTQNTPPTASMLEQTRTIPVVFVIVADPVGSGFVQSLARPGANATGFTIMEPTIAGKWLELLKEIAPRVKYRAEIVSLAGRYRLPVVYPWRFFADIGGLLSYGSVQSDMFRTAATYVDRILKGEKPADLPVQAPTRYELAINLKTAKALGLTAPPTLLARADEVIE